MVPEHPTNRRCFLKIGGLALAAGALPALAAPAHRPVRLVDPRGRPLTAGELRTGQAYLFHYPYRSTPCFLIDLGEPVEPVKLTTEDGRAYTWQGGVGPGRSIVAFSAICSHRMTHPAPSVSFINYREGQVSYRDKADAAQTATGVIYCCSEKSVFDPARGAQVLGGPAPQPLATILLEHDPASDGLTAAGTAGGALFERFFRKFGTRLMLTHGARYRAPVTGATPARPLAAYSANQVFCG